MKWLIGIVTTAAVTTLGVLAFGGSRLFAHSSVSVQNRTIYGPGGFTYYLTDGDLLWLARAAYSEAGTSSRGVAAVIWALAQYHALVLGPNGSRPKFSSLAALIQNYSVPMRADAADPNSSWCAEHPGRCTAQLISYRQEHRTRPWAQIPESVRSAVVRFSQGQLSNPVPGATDWAASDWSSRSSVPLINVGGNRFGVGTSRRLYS